MKSRAGGPGVQSQRCRCGEAETRDRVWREAIMAWKITADSIDYSARQSSKWIFVYT